MFSRIQTLQSIKDYWQQIKLLKEEIKHADAIIIGAGAGLSAAAGLLYGGQRFYDNFSDFAEKYGLQDMYAAGFYPYETWEEYWAYWSRHIYLNRYLSEAGKPYKDLLKLMQGRNYFVITTNVDHSFQKAGFDKRKLFYTQGDYGLWQCSKPCCQETYDNKEKVLEMVKQQKDMKIPAALIPYCPHCGSPLRMYLRIDAAFVENKGWHNASSRYHEFISRHKDKHILFLELGVGYNTPVIIKYPFWQMTERNKKAVYACINCEKQAVPSDIVRQTISIQADIRNAIEDLLQSC